MRIPTIFVIKFFPIAVALLTMLTFVAPSKLRVRAKAIWAMALLACASRGIVYETLGGSAQAPDFPEWLLWAWDWACSGLFILFFLSLLLVRWKGRWRMVVLPVAAWGLAAA